MTHASKTQVKPYGDHLDDGKMQFSFTLPMAAGEIAKEAARQLLEKIGFTDPMIVSMEAMGEKFTFFVAYGHTTQSIDYSKIKPAKPDFPMLSQEDLTHRVREQIGRNLVIVGGTPGTDAHTVGIDAILSIKGIHGDKGLEYYPFFKVHNLRAQVSIETLVEKAAELKADAILVSQLVTQQDQHLENLRELSRKLMNDPRFPKHMLKICGGPRMDHRVARANGFDAGFGVGTKPSEVANYIAHEIAERMHGIEKPREKTIHKATSEKPASRSESGTKKPFWKWLKPS